MQDIHDIMSPMNTPLNTSGQTDSRYAQTTIPGAYLSELTGTVVSLTRCKDLLEFATVLTDDAVTISFSDLGCFYRFGEDEKVLSLVYHKSMTPPPDQFPSPSETISFLRECPETIVLSERKPSPFSEILVNQKMQSGIVLPLYNQIDDFTEIRWVGILLLNSKRPSFYRGSLFTVLQSLIVLARGAIGVIHSTSREE